LASATWEKAEYLDGQGAGWELVRMQNSHLNKEEIISVYPVHLYSPKLSRQSQAAARLSTVSITVGLAELNAQTRDGAFVATSGQCHLSHRQVATVDHVIDKLVLGSS
jgi:hypothetical protein